MHHVHGLVNIVLGSLHCGGWLWFPTYADGTAYPRHKDSIWQWDELWNVVSGSGSGSAVKPPTDQVVVMAVPTLYSKWLHAYQRVDPETTQPQWRSRMASVRLWVAGSAALPEPVFQGWKRLSSSSSGQLSNNNDYVKETQRWTILERYGMTEIGMGK